MFMEAVREKTKILSEYPVSRQRLATSPEYKVREKTKILSAYPVSWQRLPISPEYNLIIAQLNQSDP
jgi:hypothetical protein